MCWRIQLKNLDESQQLEGRFCFRENEICANEIKKKNVEEILKPLM